MSGSLPKMGNALLDGDRPWPESLKASEDGVKKSFLFYPDSENSGEFNIGHLGSFQAPGFRAKRVQPLPFIVPFL